MYGAILGDIIGSPYEFNRGSKTKEFPMFLPLSDFTDDTVMTLAVAKGLMNVDEDADDETIRESIAREMRKDYIIREFGYDLSRTCDEIRPGYRHIESCQQTVPEAITAFLEGNSFEDVIRTAVSLGGDCDTLTAIAGSIAEGFYGVPDDLREECRKRLTPDLRKILDNFDNHIRRMHEDLG